MKHLYKILTVLLGILFLFYFKHLFEKLPQINFKEILSEVNYFYVALSLSAYLFSHVIRAIRIVVLMGRQDYSLWKLIYMQFYTNGINLILPFKLGEVYRVIEFNKLIKDSNRLLITVITEKTLDLLLLFIWALLAILFLGQQIEVLQTIVWVLLALIASSLIILFVIPENIRSVNVFLAKRYNSKWVISVLALTDRIASVIANMKHILRGNASTILLLTFAIWFFEMLGFTYLLPFMAEKSQVWLLSILVFLSSLIPSVSMGIGGLQLSFSALNYGFNSLVISLTYQTFIFAPAVLLGLLLHLYMVTKRKHAVLAPL
jgi:hypothetical protein